MARPLRIVIVDDNIDMVDTTVALLTLYGYQTKGCYGGEAALDCVREFDPDVVLLDLRMPGKSGRDVATEIRGTSKGGRPMLVAITAEPARLRGIPRPLDENNEFDYWLTKPVDQNVLLTLIEQARVHHPE